MSPPPGTVDLWSLRADPGTVAAARRGASVLDEHEALRAESLTAPSVRATYLVAHVSLRQILGRRLGLPPAEVEFARARCPRCGGPHGRPVLASDPGLHFSLSHTGDRVLIALAGSPVGVDVEAVDRRPVPGIVRRLHPDERAEIALLPEGRRSEAVLTCWVRKEAYLKATGAGLAAGLDQQYIGVGPGFGRPGPGPGQGPGPVELGGRRLLSAPEPHGHVSAVALLQPGDLPPEVRRHGIHEPQIRTPS